MRATWLALLRPKRLVPILAVSAPLLWAQVEWSVSRTALPLAVALCLAFVTLAPVSYRVLFPHGLEFSHGAVRLVLYGLVGAGVVLSVGVGVPKLLGLAPTFLTERSSLGVIVALFLVGGWGLGRDVGFEEQVDRLEREAERAQLLAMRAHLDPHFLFNTLNAIAEWCRLDGVVAEAAVLRLSTMLRTLLEGVKSPTWPLERELSLVDDLFALHLLRDAQLFSVTRAVPTPCPTFPVPPLCLLALAENAVKHGPAKGHRGELNLAVAVDARGLTVTLENPGPYQGPRPGSQGLPTLQRQLALATHGRATLSVESAGPQRTRAVLFLPTEGA